MLRRTMMAGAVATTPFDTVVAAAAPFLWWKLEETSGTTAADSSGNGRTGTLQGGATFSGSGVSVGPVTGYAGVGKGIDFAASLVDRVQTANNAANALGTSSSGAWTIVLWMAGGGGGSQYIANRQNDCAVIYGFPATADQLELFAGSFTGSDPRPGSNITLDSADTTTPHMIVYRYNNGQYTGFKNNSKIFDVARSFGLGSSVLHWNLGAADGSNYAGLKVHDFQLYDRALSDSEIANQYSAKNVT